MHTRRLFCFGDLLVMLLCAVIAVGGWLLMRGENGQAVRIVTPQETMTLPLSAPLTRTFTGNDGLTVTVEIADGQVRAEAADCPDQLCVHTGWLRQTGQTAACLPAGILLTVTGTPDAAAPDAVAR